VADLHGRKKSASSMLSILLVRRTIRTLCH
jgi:hypothetical protein